jgi:hypothetical protein
MIKTLRCGGVLFSLFFASPAASKDHLHMVAHE